MVLLESIAVVDSGSPISVPVGQETLGRLFDVLGNVIDGKGDAKTEKKTLFIVPHLSMKTLLHLQKSWLQVSRLLT